MLQRSLTWESQYKVCVLSMVVSSSGQLEAVRQIDNAIFHYNINIALLHYNIAHLRLFESPKPVFLLFYIGSSQVTVDHFKWLLADLLDNLPAILWRASERRSDRATYDLTSRPCVCSSNFSFSQ